MPEPEVQQLQNVGPTVARWRVPDVFFFCTCPLCFALVFLSYLMPSHFIGIFSLGPCILLYFFRGSTPPWQQTRVINESSLRHLLLGVYIVFPIESHICIPYFLLLHPHIKGSQDFRALRAIGLQCTPDNERDRDSPFSHRCPIYIHTHLTAVFKTRLVDDKQSFKK